MFRNPFAESSCRFVFAVVFGLASIVVVGCSDDDESGFPDSPALFEVEPTGHPGFASPHAQSIALSADGREVYVTNTANDTLDVIDARSRRVIRSIPVGIDPVSVAVRPDGQEVWVANHVSDTVSVIDIDAGSRTRYHTVATIQAWDDAGMVTDFDEPIGIAFASDEKAYVGLSSRNRLAVVDVANRRVTNQIQVFAQEPRAMRVRNGRLYVIPFESGNQTEMSGCLPGFPSDTADCTFPLLETFLANGNDAILTRNFVADIIRNPLVPDRDLFVYDTATDELLYEVSTIGTLLYGLAIDSQDSVFIALAEARNDANGKSGSAGHDLIDLENRAFLNQVAVVDCSSDCSDIELIDLEPLPPLSPDPGNQLATPFGIEISDDDSTLVAVAASSSRLFTMDAATGAVLGSLDVGGIPRALALESDDSGAPSRAWVFNSIEASVSLVDVSDPATPVEVERIVLDDPTHPDVKLGRFAFNDAAGSTTGTYSCESCHPDGNTDQLLWVLGAVCLTEGCNQVQPRSTMPIRGLRDTLPLHWDGVPGDPFGGINGEVADSGEMVEPNCTDEHSCFRHLVDGSMATTMCDQTDCPVGDSGLDGAFNEAERDAMAVFLRSVPYPPTRSRRLDDRLSDQAWDGALQFFIGIDEFRPGCSRVGVCHTLPFWAGTNTPGTGMDAPTFRGLYDRHLLLPNGRVNLWDANEFALTLEDVNAEVKWDPRNGPDELWSWGVTFGTPSFPIVNRFSSGVGPLDFFQFFEEGSMGFSGAFARQVTLNEETTGAALDLAEHLLSFLEQADADGVVDLRGHGQAPQGELSLVFQDGEYFRVGDDGMARAGFTRDQLIEDAQSGDLVVTLTARLGSDVDVDHPQPAIWLQLALEHPARASGLAEIPKLGPETSFTVFGRHMVEAPIALVDGRAVDADVVCEDGGTMPDCDNEHMRVTLAALPDLGNHTFQLVTPRGLISNEIVVMVQ